MYLTQRQRTALLRIYNNAPLIRFHGANITPQPTRPEHANQPLMTYREFRRTITKWGDVVCADWCGMMIGIESDGYTHT